MKIKDIVESESIDTNRDVNYFDYNKKVGINFKTKSRSNPELIDCSKCIHRKTHNCNGCKIKYRNNKE